ncbi:MAG: adenylate/guanylate cyclase domain-containing protein [Kiloniellales bacterium]
MERRLAAILAADVVGYSRLVWEDEASTLAALKAHREELIEPKIAERNGRVVKLMGDGLLAEFPSAVEAVQCAVEIQHLLGERDAEVAEEQRIVYRIGINIGDIVVEGDDIYGDGINVAARLEGLAEPSGICVAGNVFDQVKDKLDLTLDHLGERELKNIAEPVTVYRVVPDEKAAALVTPVVRKAAKRERRWLPVAAVATAAIIIALSGVLWWQPWAPDVEPTSVEKMALPLPDKPSIAVLPFANMSGDPEQEYFADGISEDLTTQLSKISGLFVISRTTTFQYKGRTADIRQIAQDLGVRYVVEGSVRRGGNDVRVNAQLIDATTGGHLWAETFDGPVGEVFALQDRINEKIVTALKVQLTPEELARVTYRGTENVVAYDAFLRGERFRLHSKVRAHEEAILEYERAIALDPNFSAAHAALGLVLWDRVRRGKGGVGREDNIRAHQLANTALALGEDPATHTLLAKIHLVEKGDYTSAEAEARKAIAIDPNNSEGLATLAEVSLYMSRPKVATQLLQKAMRADPGFPFSYQILMAQARFEQKRYRDVINLLTAVCEGVVAVSYIRPCQIYSASAYGHLGEMETGQKILKLSGFHGDDRHGLLNEVKVIVAIRFPFKNLASREHLIEGIRMALQID